MVEPPSFLNVNDFLGVFLPGYVAVTLYLVLFQPQLIFDEATALPFDVFSAIVFIIAGPTIGAALKQFHRQVVAISLLLYLGSTRYMDSTKWYAKIRLKVSDAKKIELDRTEAVYDFCISTFIASVVLAIYHIASEGVFDSAIHIPIFVLAAILLPGGILQIKYSLNPTLDELQLDVLYDN